MAITRRNHTDEVHGFISPFAEMNVGLWLLFAGATFFLGLRVWVKLTRRYGLWIDDYILLVSWVYDSTPFSTKSLLLFILTFVDIDRTPRQQQPHRPRVCDRIYPRRLFKEVG